METGTDMTRKLFSHKQLSIEIARNPMQFPLILACVTIENISRPISGVNIIYNIIFNPIML